MSAKTLISVLAILFLLSPLACPLMAAPKTEHSSHDCTRQPHKQENQGMHPCCDQRAIQAKVFEQKYSNSAEMLPLVDSDSTANMSNVIKGLQDSAHLHLKTGDLLAKLSILRI